MRALRQAAWIPLLAAAGCMTVDAAPHTRPAQRIPAEVAARYALPGPLRELDLVHIGGDADFVYGRGRVASGDEIAEFHLIEPVQGAARNAPQPFILMLPILAGGQELMWLFGTEFAERGYTVAWPRRVESALTQNQRGPELETLFRRSIVHARMLLAWARRQPGIDDSRHGLVGFSLGSMIGSAVLAVEPDVRFAALCLAGGDLPDMVMVSEEPRAVRWRRYRSRDDGTARSETLRDLDRHLVSDPARLARYVDTERVLLVSAWFDGVVPVRNQDLLWEALGRPRRLHLPLGHYTALLGMWELLAGVEAFAAVRGCAPGPGTEQPRRGGRIPGPPAPRPDGSMDRRADEPTAAMTPK